MRGPVAAGLVSALLVAIACTGAGSGPAATETAATGPRVSPTPVDAAPVADVPTPPAGGPVPKQIPFPTATPTPPPTSTPDPDTIPPAPTAPPALEPTPVPVVREQAIPRPPSRDVVDLARRFKLQSADDQRASAGSEPLKEGQPIQFWVNRPGGYVLVDGVVKAASDNAYWVFDAAREVDPADLQAAIDEFESSVWPTVTGLFGGIRSPGIDDDPRLVIFHTSLRPGIAGYFSSTDAYPADIQPYSNERESIYISTDGLTVGSRSYMSVLTHELQHAVHWAADPDEESWLNEGLSELAVDAAGHWTPKIADYLRLPGTSLTQWPSGGQLRSPSYGGANLFLDYLAEHYGGDRLIAELVKEPTDGLESVDRVLERLGEDVTSLDVFRDWVVANYLNDPEGRYSSSARKARSAIRVRSRLVNLPKAYESEVAQFGADYYVVTLPADELTISFNGDPRAELFPVAPHSGDACWWSNDGDGIDTTLTRRFDLTGVDAATLRFNIWYAVEEDWDFAYVEVSDDGGDTWTILDTTLTTNENPNGTSFGPGITGESNGWVEDSVDLTPYAGSEVLVRFEYVTDDAVNGRGLCLDDFAVEEIGWTDDAEDDGGWEANGFARVNNLVPEEFLVQIVRKAPGGSAEVTRLFLDGQADGEVRLAGVNADPDEQVAVIVSAVTREAGSKAGYVVGFGAS